MFARRSVRVRNRPQPSVRGPYGRVYGKFCRGGHFWRFQTCRCFVSRGRRGTSWHSDVFCKVLKIVLRGKHNTFVTFSEDVLQFSWQAQHFGRVHRHFSCQAQHFRRVLLRVFCKSHWQGCVKWRQGANSGRRGIFWHVLKINRSPARNIDFEVANFQVLRKTRRKTSILKLQSVKIGGSLACLVFPWPHRVYGGSCKTCPFVVLPTVKIAGRLAQNAGFSASTCLVSSRLFFCGVAVSMGEAGKPVLFECFQAGCHVVLHGRRGTFWHSTLFDNVSKMSKLNEVSHEMFVFLHVRVSFRVFGFPVASPCLWGKVSNVSFAKVSNFECTGLLVQWGLRFVKIWQECDYVEGGKLLCGLIQISHSVVFPECVARVPVSFWGSGGWGCVRSTLRPRPQPSARRPYGRAYGKFCRGVHFWRFQTRRCFVLRGRRGTSWHSDVFCNVLKIVLRGRRNTFVTFSEDVLLFSCQAQHFGRVPRHFSCQA